MWEPGTKVECVDDRPDWLGRPANVVRGEIYTVESTNGQQDSAGEFGVRLVEAKTYPDNFQHTFRASRFRPIQERKLPECLTELLRTPKRESEPA